MRQRMFLCTDDHPAHGLYGFDRISAAGGLGREHHRIGTIEHCVGHIEHFGTGWHRLADHGLHHLRRRNHHPIQGSRPLDDQLLHGNQFGIANLYPQVTSRHHHTIRGLDNGIQHPQVIDGLGPFDLGNQPRLASRLAH
ncbi:hypothetical protein D3C76_699890 [compost metagenome]